MSTKQKNMSSNVSSKPKQKTVSRTRGKGITYAGGGGSGLHIDTWEQGYEKGLQDGRKEAVKILNTYKCNFNWDPEKDKAKHKVYIELSEVLSQLEGEKLTNA